MEIFSMLERSKSKHKFGGTKVCEANEVREYFINILENFILSIFYKIDKRSFCLVCKLSYL